MTKRGGRSSEQPPSRPISLVCVSAHKNGGPSGKEPDKLMSIRGKWAWCPSDAAEGHKWQPVAPGSLNALHVQLIEVSRLLDVALDASGAAKGTDRVVKRTSHTTGRPTTRGRRP